MGPPGPKLLSKLFRPLSESRQKRLRQLQILLHVLPGPGGENIVLNLDDLPRGPHRQGLPRLCQADALAPGGDRFQVDRSLRLQLAQSGIHRLLAQAGTAADLPQRTGTPSVADRIEDNHSAVGQPQLERHLVVHGVNLSREMIVPLDRF